MRKVAKLNVIENNVLPITSSLASVPEKGSIAYYNVDDSIYVSNGTSWFTISKPINLITVSNTGSADYDNVKDAVNYAATLLPTRSAVVVYPGVYIENNPITIPSGISLVGEGGPLATTIVALNSGSVLFNLGNGCFVENIVTSGSSAAIRFDGSVGSSSGSILKSCIITDATTCVESFNGPAELFCVETLTRISAGSITNGFYASAGGKMRCFTCGVFGTSSTNITNGVHCTGTNSMLVYFSGGIQYCDNGLLANDGGRLEGKSVLLRDSESSLVLGSTGTTSTLSANDITIYDSVNYDLDIQATAGNVTCFGGTLRNDLVNNPNNIQYYSNSFNERPGDQALQIVGELHVGTYNQPTESAFGGGDSYVNGLKVLTDDGTGTSFIDISSDVADPSITSSLFQGTAVGNVFYVGGDIPFYGKKADTVSAWGANDSANIAREYWDGSTWTDFNIMNAQSGHPYATTAQNIFITAGSSQVRYGDMSGWATTTVNSITAYWVRFRVTSIISAIPTISLFKLHSSRTEINSDGYIEYFGKARVIKTLPWDLNLVRPASNSPDNRDTYVSDNLAVGRVENRYSNGLVQRSGLNSYLPFDFDTSYGIKTKWAFFGEGPTGGTVEFVLRWGWTNDGDDIYPSAAAAPTTGPNEQSITITTPAITVTNQQLTGEIILPFPDISARPVSGNPDIIWITFQRNGSTDSYTGNIVLTQMEAAYISWCEGGHIDSF